MSLWLRRATGIFNVEFENGRFHRNKVISVTVLAGARVLPPGMKKADA
jgi:hypothetical protein